MLSRVGEAIYWMNRYIERAENYARFIDVNPEDALERTNKKFIKRFQYLESKSKALNKPLKDETGFNEGHEAFLKMLIGKLESGHWR